MVQFEYFTFFLIKKKKNVIWSWRLLSIFNQCHLKYLNGVSKSRQTGTSVIIEMSGVFWECKTHLELEYFSPIFFFLNPFPKSQVFSSFEFCNLVNERSGFFPVVFKFLLLHSWLQQPWGKMKYCRHKCYVILLIFWLMFCSLISTTPKEKTVLLTHVSLFLLWKR